MAFDLPGPVMYLISVLSIGGIYAMLTLGLNVQWGFTGLFNLGIAGFFAVGAYTSALLTMRAGLGWPIPLGLLGAMAASAVIAFLVGRLALRLQSDYLAIATIGIAEVIRLFLKNEEWLTNGPRGLSGIPAPIAGLAAPWHQLVLLAFVLGIVLVLYLVLERARRSPWGRVMRAIRDNERAAQAAGKDTTRFRLQAFVVGSAIIGLGGAVYAHYVKFISPGAFEPLMTTFIVWVMLIAGGSGNNRGAILGAVLVWAIWSATELVTSRLPAEWATQAAALRLLLIGVALQIILQRASKGVLPEQPPGRAAPEAAPEARPGPAAAMGRGPGGGT